MKGIAVLCTALAVAAPIVLAQGDVPRKSIEESRRIADQVSVALRDQLIREMQISGPVRSLIACKFSCPEILSTPSRRTGWRIAAVSLKPRNPALGAADAWEQRVLLDMGRRVAAGEKAEGLEAWEVVAEPQGRFFRYAVAMPVEPMCLACHGKADSISAPVKAQLAVDYPFDRAIGFGQGDIYGIVSIKQPL